MTPDRPVRRSSAHVNHVLIHWSHACFAISLTLSLGAACATTTKQPVHTPAVQPSDPPDLGIQLEVDENPKLIRQTTPRYPPDAFYKGIEGTVELEILIDKTGRVSRMRIVKSIPALDAAAVKCVMKWQFRPAQLHGQPVATIASAPVTFTIRKKK